MRVVCNSSVLIALRAIGRLKLLHQVFGEVTIPEAVAREVFRSRKRIPVRESILELAGE